MKIITLAAALLVLIGLQTSLTSCNSSPVTTTLPGSWDNDGVSDFGGIPRSGAVSFVINGIAYVGLGYNYENNSRLIDFWKYDQASNSWKPVAPNNKFPGVARTAAVAFVINNKAYVGSGDDGLNRLSDFYEFDPAGDGGNGTWSRIADLGYSTPGNQDTSQTVRYGAVGFSVKNRGFVAGGHNLSSFNDLWEYNTATGAWEQRPSTNGKKRKNAWVMVIGDYAYLGGGTDDNGQFAKDFYKFDVTQINVDGSGTPWTALSSFIGKDINGNAVIQPKARELACTFTIPGDTKFGYLVAGSTGGPTAETWQYNSQNDTWIQYYSFSNNWPTSGPARSGAVGFALGKYGYMTTGGSGAAYKFDDCWKFDPNGKEPDNK